MEAVEKHFSQKDVYASSAATPAAIAHRIRRAIPRYISRRTPSQIGGPHSIRRLCYPDLPIVANSMRETFLQHPITADLVTLGGVPDSRQPHLLW